MASAKSTVPPLHLDIVDYSQYAIAVFGYTESGATKDCKDSLKELGGMYNAALTYNGKISLLTGENTTSKFGQERREGWVFSKKKGTDVVLQFVNDVNAGKIAPAQKSASSSTSASVQVQPQHLAGLDSRVTRLEQEFSLIKALLQKNQPKVEIPSNESKTAEASVDEDGDDEVEIDRPKPRMLVSKRGGKK